MKYLLLGGAQSVGKTETIYRTAQFLLGRGFTVHSGTIPTTPVDFTAVLQGVDNSGVVIYILVNGATDTPAIINNFVKFYNGLSITVDIIISSVRDGSYSERQYFFQQMNINLAVDSVLEIPLAKITRQGGNFPPAIRWYRQTLDTLIKHSLARNPFNL